jgi:ketosteroid isomerase-like protein
MAAWPYGDGRPKIARDPSRGDVFDGQAGTGRDTPGAGLAWPPTTDSQDTEKDLNMSNTTAVDLLRRSLDTFLAKDMKGWTELCAEDVVAEFPFAPEGSPARIEGRAALYEYLRGYPDAIDVRALPTLKTYATDDPNVAIAEWSASGQVLANGNPYEMRYATFVTFRDGLIVNYREYWNPLAFLNAMSGARFDG